MPVAIVKATARFVVSHLGGVAPPTYDQITSAFREVRPEGNESARGNWIGPGPRVTRTGIDASLVSEQTVNVAWTYGWPTGGPWSTTAPHHDLVAALVSAVSERLNGTIPFVRLTWSVTSSVYNPVVNGPTTWWVSGDATRTQTRTAPVDGVTETPWGPPQPSMFAIPPRPQPQAPGTSTAVVVGVAGLSAGALALAWYSRKRGWL